MKPKQNENGKKARRKKRMLIFFFQEASTEVFKEKRALDQMRVTLNDVTTERNSLSEEKKLLQSQVSFDFLWF